MKREQETVIEDALLNAFRQGQIARRQFMQMMIIAGMGMAGVGVQLRHVCVGSAAVQTVKKPIPGQLVGTAGTDLEAANIIRHRERSHGPARVVRQHEL